MRELNGHGLAPSIAQAIEEMKAAQGERCSLDHINLAELERRSGVSCGKLRRLKRNGFCDLTRSTKGRKHTATKLSGYAGLLDSLLCQGVKNSSVVLERLQQAGFEGHPVWQKDYEAFMKALGFETKLCKSRHPFTKGKVERLVRFVKDNFLAGRVFYLNWQALEWYSRQNGTYH